MPLTAKGHEILENLKKEYGSEKKAEQVLYAGKNKGTFTGIDDAKDARRQACDAIMDARRQRLQDARDRRRAAIDCLMDKRKARLATDAFRESEHPRARGGEHGGEFTSGSGGSGSSAKGGGGATSARPKQAQPISQPEALQPGSVPSKEQLMHHLFQDDFHANLKKATKALRKQYDYETTEEPEEKAAEWHERDEKAWDAAHPEPEDTGSKEWDEYVDAYAKASDARAEAADKMTERLQAQAEKKWAPRIKKLEDLPGWEEE